MTTIQVKTEIEQTLDRMPEERLPDILDAACLLKSDLIFLLLKMKSMILQLPPALGIYDSKRLNPG